MPEARLQSSFWIKACIRRADQEGIAATVVHKGDGGSGAILVKLNRRDLGCWVLAETQDGQGRRAWFYGTGTAGIPEADADTYIERHRRRDPDLWVIEIDDRAGRRPFDDPVLD